MDDGRKIYNTPQPIEIMLEVAEILTDISGNETSEIADKTTCDYVNEVIERSDLAGQRTKQDEHQRRGHSSADSSQHTRSVDNDVPSVRICENAL